ADFLEIEEEDFDRVLRVNLKGVFLVGQHAGRAMVAGGRRGSIVNMSSINSQVALPDQVPYCTAKGGILAAIARQRPVPVYFIGVGEQVEDLQPFSAREFADALLG
ncbi:MAG: SDR family NAD(P)-dependent oxidoreductase, partial [Ralstonia sp.]